MIERLTGDVLAKSADKVVIDVSGVGFQLEVSSLTSRDVPPVGQEVTIFTHLHVREDAIQLFGFSTDEERELFRMLLGVSKIGPKLALAALSCRRAPELRRALASGDVALLASIPGIGRKTAERIVLELREKMGDLGAGERGAGEYRGEEGADSMLVARSALVELGYTIMEADRLLSGMDQDLPVEELVRRALGGA